MLARTWCLWCVCAVGAAAGAGRPALLERAAYELESTVLLNDVARADKEVGYKLRARLRLRALWAAPDTDYLLEFQLQSPKLYLRGKHVNAEFMPHESVWDSYSDTTFYAHWSNGLIKTAYLDPNELPDVLNYKKSLLSLFQFQLEDGEYNETDVSGACDVLYETISTDVFRKIKTACSADGAGAVVSARRVARYSRDARGALLALHAEELLALAHAQLGLKARSWHALRRAGEPPAPAPAAAGLQEALRALPAARAEHALELQATGDEDEPPEELEAVLSDGALQDIEHGGGGTARAAAAALRLLPAARRANQTALLHLLQRDQLHDHLDTLCGVLGLAGTRAAHAAAQHFLQLHARDVLRPLAHAYLAAFALAPAADDAAVRDVLRLGEEARDADLADAALLAAAAAARARPALSQHVRDALARGLARCRDERCRTRGLRALHNLRRRDTADLLLQHAEARSGPAALAALDALAASPPDALTFARLDRLTALALDERAPLELRAAALDLLVQRRAALDLPVPLAHVAHALHARGPHELRRVLWQRLGALAPQHAGLRALPALLGPALRSWDARAPAGSSSVLVRALGWAAGGWRAALDSVQVARAGLLRRGTVRLFAADEQQHALDALTVEVWTRGMEAFGGAGAEGGAGGGEAEGEGGAEEAAGGLALSVGGVRMRDISLFNGQAELLGHVWAGTASAPTPVLRALLPLHERAAAVPLLAGVRAHVAARAALALALDAQAQVSLWWRSARAELELRAAAAADASARLRTAWGAVSASAAVQAEPRLRIAADLDFYDAPALCVRVASDEHVLRREVALRAELGARRLRVRRRRREARAAPGRSLALGRPNDAVCRTLRSVDHDADRH